ncbi:hypothetical protein [Clostridium sp.]|uniref:hypothetical protein n=1 Tax=Clostridium sp. TaxID=1506 RepID=UPI001A62B74C|nr:hypothetical protein [Clostridium sp.]MBK5243161.1 hypothetical protein [Clostridium sp.]
MEENKIKIVEHGNAGCNSEFFLNGEKVDYMTSYRIVKTSTDIAEVTITFEGHEIEIVKSDVIKDNR